MITCKKKKAQAIKMKISSLRVVLCVVQSHQRVVSSWYVHQPMAGPVWGHHTVSSWYIHQLMGTGVITPCGLITVLVLGFLTKEKHYGIFPPKCLQNFPSLMAFTAFF